MKKFPLKLEDLNPTEFKFKLSPTGDREFTLCRWSLRVRGAILKKYTSAKLKEIFEKTMIDEMADIAYFMLKSDDKTYFEELGKTQGLDGFEAFLDSISTIQDNITITKAVIGTLGIGEPEIKAISDSIKPAAQVDAEKADQDPNEQSPNPTT